MTAGARQPGSEWSWEGRGPHRSWDFLLRMGPNGLHFKGYRTVEGRLKQRDVDNLNLGKGQRDEKAQSLKRY